MEGEGGYDKYSSCALTCPIQLHRGRTSLPVGHFPGCTRGQTTYKTDKSSCGALFRVHQGTGYTEDGQVFPWDSFQGAPGDRLHRGWTSLPLGPFFRGYQGTDYTKTNESSPRTLFRVHQGTSLVPRPRPLMRKKRVW